MAGSIPTPTSSACFRNITNFDYTFSGCTSLTGTIPASLFTYATNVTSFEWTFDACSGITGAVPASLFEKNTKATNFWGTFISSGISSAPPTLFQYNTAAQNFCGTFADCQNLTKVLNYGTQITTGYEGRTITLSGSEGVPVYYSNTLNLSTNTKYMVSFDYYCKSGTNQFDVDLFPDSLPQQNPTATTTIKRIDIIFSSTSSDMGSCQLRFFDDVQESSESDIVISNIVLKKVDYEIAHIFAKNVNATSFESTFLSCSNLSESIPSGMFMNNTKSTRFDCVFSGCNLTGTIPSNLFRGCTNVTTYSGTFQHNANLTGSIPDELFYDSRTKITSFRTAFIGCEGLNGSCPALWDTSVYTQSPEGYYCFGGCTSLTNYNSIPSGWK